MENKQIVLKLFVEGLGAEGAIDSFSARKDFQKEVLLGQSLSGIDLGYRFNWYLRGPYSPALARDYYEMTEAIELGDTEFEGHALVESARRKLNQIRHLFDAPTGSPLRRSDWVELLASWHYLRSISKCDEATARETMIRTKPLLAPHIEAAKRALQPFEHLG